MAGVTGSGVTFQRLAATLSKDKRVDPPETAKAKGFGSKGLKAGRKMFAFHSKGRLVVKLAADRVDALVAAGAGHRFDPGHGRLMREWLAVPYDKKRIWPRLAREALDFARSRGRAGAHR
jgi:hypothetical protein